MGTDWAGLYWRRKGPRSPGSHMRRAGGGALPHAAPEMEPSSGAGPGLVPDTGSGTGLNKKLTRRPQKYLHLYLLAATDAACCLLLRCRLRVSSFSRK